MQVMHERVAGLDVHKDSVVACVRLMSGSKATHECRTFETTTSGLLSLLEWLVSYRCELVAMEGTGGLLDARLEDLERRPIRDARR